MIQRFAIWVDGRNEGIEIHASSKSAIHSKIMSHSPLQINRPPELDLIPSSQDRRIRDMIQRPLNIIGSLTIINQSPGDNLGIPTYPDTPSSFRGV